MRTICAIVFYLYRRCSGVVPRRSLDGVIEITATPVSAQMTARAIRAFLPMDACGRC